MLLPRNFPLRLVLGLALTVVIDTVVQLSWKVGVLALPELTASLASVEAVLSQPMLYVVVGLLLVQLCNWLVVLDHADVSFAQPFTAMSRISVCLASALVLGERVTALQATGILMVCVGAWCIGQTDRKTAVATQPEAGA